ncbi:hypothetical protein CI102_10106 [Trichoderma harzianum]|nr:hypothetical protein CI102_10106 [Trichoderma harzianum]
MGRPATCNLGPSACLVFTTPLISFTLYSTICDMIRMHAMRIECHHSHHHHHDVVAADRIVVRHSNVHQPLAALGQLRGFAKAPSQQPCAELTGIVSGNASIEFVSAPGTASFSSPHHLAQKLVCSWRGFFGHGQAKFPAGSPFFVPFARWLARLVGGPVRGVSKHYRGVTQGVPSA